MVFPLSRLAARISHWHTPFYSDPVLGMKDATIVGVSDPDAERAAPLAAQAKCPSSPIPRAGTRAAI
jgi:hypothetical protein